MIYGINLLSAASSVIGLQEVTWRRFKGREQNDRGFWITEYHDPVVIKGSWQPVPESTIRDLGLDATRRYYNLYSSHEIATVSRGESPDIIDQGGYSHEVVGRTDWYAQNGWRGILCVEIGPVEEDPEDPDDGGGDESEET